MPNPKKRFTIEEARAYAKRNPKSFNQALDKINPDPYRGTKKFADLLIKQYPERYKNFTPQHFISMLDSISKVESGNKNIAQRSINPKTKKAIDGPARGYYQMETNTTPTAAKRYKNYQDIFQGLSAVPLPDINVPTSGDVRSLSKDEQARLALANMSATATSKKGMINPQDSQSSWLDYHWNGNANDRPARQQHWKETFGYGDGGRIKAKDGIITPYVTNDPNDPRIQAYRDSSDKFMGGYNELQKARKKVKQNIDAFSYRSNKYLSDSEKIAIKTFQATKQRFDYKPQYSEQYWKSSELDKDLGTLSKKDMNKIKGKSYLKDSSYMDAVSERAFEKAAFKRGESKNSPIGYTAVGDQRYLNTLDIDKQDVDKYGNGLVNPDVKKVIGRSYSLNLNDLMKDRDKVIYDKNKNYQDNYLDTPFKEFIIPQYQAPKQKVILNKPQSKPLEQLPVERLKAKPSSRVNKPKPVEQFQDTVVVPQVTPQAQTQINTGSSTPVTLGMSSPDSTTGKRLYRYGNKNISEQEFNKYKTLGKHKIVEYNFGGTLGNILSAASPFLSMIPGGGAIAAPLAGIAGQMLQGTNQPQQQSGQQSRQQYIQRQSMNNYGGQGYATGGRMINEGNGIEHAYGPSHEQGGIQYDGQSEIEGGEKVLDGNYVLTDQPNSNLDKTQMSISRRFDKDHKAISDRNPRSNSDKAKEFLKQDAMQKNDIYLQARHEKMMSKIGKIAKKYGYGGDLESLSAELGVYQNGGRKSVWNTPMNQRQQTTIFDNSQVPVYLDRYGVTLPDMTNINSSKRSQTGNSQYSDIYPRYQDAIRPSEETRLNHPIYNAPQTPDQYDTPDYDARNPNDYSNRRLPANAPDRVKKAAGRPRVQKPHEQVEVPETMSPRNNVQVNNQRIIPAVPYNGISNQSAADPTSAQQPWNPYNRPGDPWNEANKLTYPGSKSQGRQADPNSPYVQHGNQTPWSMDAQTPPPTQGQGANFGRIAETIGTYAPGIYNLARGIFDKTDQMNAGDYMIPQQSPYLIPTQTGEGEIRDAYTRGLYDMRGSGTYSKLGQVNLTNQRAKNNYERKLQIMGVNAGIRNQTASQNSNINAQNAQMRQGVYDWNARSRAQKGNFVGQGISDLSTGIQNERNYRNDLAGIDMAFDNPTTKNYIEYLRSGRRQPRTK